MIRMCALAASLAFSLSLQAAASKRPVLPSKTKIKPLALEFRLIAHMAKEKPRFKATLVKRATRLQRYGGTGYGINATHVNPEAATRQLRQRKAAYMALTAVPLKEAAGRVTAFAKKEKIRIKASARAAKNKGRAAPIYALIGGIANTVKKLENQLRSLRQQADLLRRTPSIGGHGDVRAAARIEEQIQRVQSQRTRLSRLSGEIGSLVAAVTKYDALEDDIRNCSKKEGRAQRSEVLAKKAAQFAAADKGIAEATAVGTQQVRFTVTNEKRKAIEQALTTCIEGQERKKIGFITDTLDFLPLIWKPAEALQPKGDYRVTEYVCGEELFLTVFDCEGIWYRIVVVDYQKKLYVLVPPKAG